MIMVESQKKPEMPEIPGRSVRLSDRLKMLEDARTSKYSDVFKSAKDNIEIENRQAVQWLEKEAQKNRIDCLRGLEKNKKEKNKGVRFSGYTAISDRIIEADGVYLSSTMIHARFDGGYSNSVLCSHS